MDRGAKAILNVVYKGILKAGRRSSTSEPKSPRNSKVLGSPRGRPSSPSASKISDDGDLLSEQEEKQEDSPTPPVPMYDNAFELRWTKRAEDAEAGVDQDDILPEQQVQTTWDMKFKGRKKALDLCGLKVDGGDWLMKWQMDVDVLEWEFFLLGKDCQFYAQIHAGAWITLMWKSGGRWRVGGEMQEDREFQVWFDQQDSEIAIIDTGASEKKYRLDPKNGEIEEGADELVNIKLPDFITKVDGVEDRLSWSRRVVRAKIRPYTRSFENVMYKYVPHQNVINIIWQFASSGPLAILAGNLVAELSEGAYAAFTAPRKENWLLDMVNVLNRFKARCLLELMEHTCIKDLYETDLWEAEPQAPSENEIVHLSVPRNFREWRTWPDEAFSLVDGLLNGLEGVGKKEAERAKQKSELEDRGLNNSVVVEHRTSIHGSMGRNPLLGEMSLEEPPWQSLDSLFDAQME